MPLIWIPQEEFEALQAVLTRAALVNWLAYERAREYLIAPVLAPVPLPLETKQEERRVNG